MSHFFLFQRVADWILPSRLLFANARIDGGWGKFPILEHAWLTPLFLLMQQGISLSEIVAGRGVLSPWSSQECSDSVELLVPEG